MESLKDGIVHADVVRGIPAWDFPLSFARSLRYKRGLTMNHEAQSVGGISLVLMMLLVLGGLAGCAEIVKVPYSRPMPATFTLKPLGVETIAVLNFEGLQDSGGTLAELLTTKLVQGNYYKVVERERLNKIMNEQKLGMTGMIDETTAAQVGKLAGVNAVLMGNVNTYSVKDEPYTKTVMVSRGTGRYRTECNKKGECHNVEIVEQVPMLENHHRRNGTVSATQKVVLVETGRVVGAKNATEQYKYDTGNPPMGEGVMGFRKPVPEQGQAEVLTSLTEKVAENLAGAIQSHTIQEEGEFELGGMAAVLGEMGADKEIKQGIEMTKAGRVDEAAQLYESIINKDPRNCSAIYNAGIIHMESEEFQKADTAFRAAEKCNLKPRYTAAVGENKKRWDKIKQEQQKTTSNPTNK